MSLAWREGGDIEGVGMSGDGTATAPSADDGRVDVVGTTAVVAAFRAIRSSRTK